MKLHHCSYIGLLYLQRILYELQDNKILETGKICMI